MPDFRSAFIIALSAVALAIVPAHAQVTSASAFIDRFRVLDESRWFIADGWTNGDWTANDWRRSQVSSTPRGLAIVLARQHGADKPFTSGEVRTHQVHRYGYFEARMRVPRGSSMVTGFFTFTRPDGRRSWDEIDIEILGRDTRSILFSYFNDGERRMHEHQLGFDAAEGLHTYAFEWTPRYIRWYVDGRLRHEATGAEVPIPDAPQRLYLNLWNSETLTSWVGPLPQGGRQWRLLVSCIAHAAQYRGRPLCAN